MEAKEKIICALDVNSVDKALELVEMLKDEVGAFKIGLEFIYSMLGDLILTGKILYCDGYPIEISPNESLKVVTKLQKIGKLFKLLNNKLFLDSKLKDIPNTVAGAALAISEIGVKMFNVHCLGGNAMMKAAKKEAREYAEKSPKSDWPIVLGVTLLTSLNYEDLTEMGICDKINFDDLKEKEKAERRRVELLVRRSALLAQDCGLDGVIASPRELKILRECCQPEFLIVTPGIRPEWAASDDQKRIMTPGEAIRLGADYLVIGRPITDPPKEIGTPLDAVKLIQKEIESAQMERR